MADVVYKALVPTRWKNRLTGKHEYVHAGHVVSFEDGDFALPDEPSTALPPIDAMIARGQFEVWDPAHAGDPDYMSRDEMIQIITTLGLTEDAPEHDSALEVLRPIVQAHLDRLTAAGNTPQPTSTVTGSRQRRAARDATSED